MNKRSLLLSALLVFGGSAALAQTDTISSLAIGTASTAGGTANGVATIVPRIGTPLNQPGGVRNDIAGLQYVPGQIPLNGAPSSVAFFTLSSAAIPSGGGPATAFTSYGTLITPTAITTYSDVASKLTPGSYSGLTFAEANLGFGSRAFYSIHHKPGADYLAQIVPGTGTSSAIFDLKPMSWTGPTAGGPASAGATGYFGIAWATGILSAGAPYADESLYYLRTDSGGNTQFGVMVPALTGASADTINLTNAVGSFGVGGYTTLAFSPSVVGNLPANQFYYLRQDTVTGNTILGRLNPSLVAGTRTISDIANLGGVFDTLNFAADATGPAGAWGTSQFYISGALAAGAQSVSFEAIPDHNVGDVFTITPTASSGLDIDVTVVSGPATIQTTGVSGAMPLSLRAFTVTTTGPGIVTLQATQAGRTLPLPAYTTNMLRQSFRVAGLPTITGATSAPATVGTAFTYSIASTGSPTSYTASPLPAGVTLDSATGVINGTPTSAGTTIVSTTSTNPTGTSNPATLTITVGSAAVAPILTSATTTAGTVNTSYNFAITATGVPTSYAASPLPAGLVLNSATGAITGTPTASGSTIAAIQATNSAGTSSGTLTFTIAAATVAPIITSPSSAAGTVGTSFVTYQITATGLPTSYTATGLPPGLTLNLSTGAINGTPTAAGTSTATLRAINSAGSNPATLTITVAAAAAAPIITSPTTTPAGVAGAPFTTYQIVATGLPTSFSATGLPAGLTVNTLTGAINGTPTVSGTFPVTINATNSSGTSTTTLTIVVAAAPVAPIITSPATAPGGTAGAPFPTYQIVGSGLPTSFSATGLPAGLTVNPLTGAIDGTPTESGTFPVTISATNSTGTSTTTLTIVIAAAPTSRIVNFSARALSGPGSQTLIVGFVVSGNGKNLLLRGIGPSLGALGVVNFLPDPMLTLYSPSAELAANDNWQTPVGGGASGAVIAATAIRVGAFALPAGSADAALLLTVNDGAHTTGLVRPNGVTGIALTEIYDTDTGPGARLVNVSARMYVSPGEGTLIGGLVISGDAPRTVLIRGVGPTLATMGVTGVLANPKIVLYSRAGNAIAENDNWGTGSITPAAMAAAAARVGAFALPSGSNDAAMLVTLEPGAYTVHVTGVGTPTGVALVEVYDVE